ncbi:MAG TPA: YeeE/YedE thiosulfate transporter family protein, partial [Saprospiraceae bacterium]|nr:YeeE/YedE thiosulfate transporter family protein [Saprospiraceae bacterium]
SELGIRDFSNILPKDIFNSANIFTFKGLFFFIVGGFLVGFGTRYAGGCTSGHSITGLSNLQFSSLVATICFMIGGFISANIILPFILHILN